MQIGMGVCYMIKVEFYITGENVELMMALKQLVRHVKKISLHTSSFLIINSSWSK